MDSKTIVIHCTFSDEDTDLSQIIRDSFQAFLYRELRTFARDAADGIS